MDAIRYFKLSPLWGAGIDVLFHLRSGVAATHAHSFLLDILAKFGAITFLPYVGLLICLVRRSAKCQFSQRIFFVGVFLFAANLHMLFDPPSNYFLILFFEILETVITGTTEKMRKVVERGMLNEKRSQKSN